MHSLKNKTAVTLAILAMGSLFVGCDKLESETRQTDKKVDAAIDDALANRDQGLGAVKTGLQQATAQASASPMSQARSNGMLGQVEVRMANDLLPRIDDGQVRMSHLLTQIRQLGDSIASGNALLNGYRKYDPEEIKTAAAKRVAAATGDANTAEWIKNDAGAANGGKPLPTLSAVNQEISRLEGEITKAQDELKDLGSKRNDFLKEADGVDQQSRDKGGKEGLDLYKRASELRKKAADVRIEMDKIQNRMVPLQGDLAVANVQKQVLTEAVGQFEEQSQQADKSAAEINQRSQDQAKVSQSIAEGPGLTIAAKANELAELEKKIKADRDAAIELLTSAVNHFNQASAGAGQMELALGTRLIDLPTDSPERSAVEGLKTLYSPQIYRLDKAMAQQTLGMLQARQAQLYKQWDDTAKVVKNAMDQAGLKAPAALADGEATRQYSKAKTEANQAFQEAHEACQMVVDASNTSPTDKAAARVTDIFTLYAWSEFQQENGDASGAKTNLASAKEALKSAKDDGLTLPAIPAGLSPVVVAPTPAASAPAAAASATETTADSPVAAEVKKTIQEVIDGMTKGDADVIKSHLNSTPAQQPFIDTITSLMTGGLKLQKAMEAKFGEAGKQALAGGGAGGAGGMNFNAPKPEDIQKLLSTIQIVSTAADSATITMPGQKDKLPLKKIDGVWKVDLAAMANDPKMVMAMGMGTMILKPITDNINQVATDVEAGKYATVDEVKEALKKGMPQMGMPPGGGGGGAAPDVAGQPQPPAGGGGGGGAPPQ